MCCAGPPGSDWTGWRARRSRYPWSAWSQCLRGEEKLHTGRYHEMHSTAQRRVLAGDSSRIILLLIGGDARAVARVSHFGLASGLLCPARPILGCLPEACFRCLLADAVHVSCTYANRRGVKVFSSISGASVRAICQQPSSLVRSPPQSVLT